MPIGIESAKSASGILTREKLFLTAGASSTVPTLVPGILADDFIKQVLAIQFTGGVPQAGSDVSEDWEIVTDGEIVQKAGGGGADYTGFMLAIVWYDRDYLFESHLTPGNN